MADILVVDDDHDNRSLLRQILESEGMGVECAVSGEDALRKIELKNFRLMVTDLNMPGMDGFVLARRVAAILPQMPVVMMTGELAPEIAQLAQDAGIKMVLRKPFRPAQLFELIHSLCPIVVS